MKPPISPRKYGDLHLRRGDHAPNQRRDDAGLHQQRGPPSRGRPLRGACTAERAEEVTQRDPDLQHGHPVAITAGKFIHLRDGGRGEGESNME